jgi:AAA+ ATPase superfamily predicted ATPase
MKESINPFGITAYLGASYFCDREEETELLLKNIRQNDHTAFFALRRMGKTALIQHVFGILHKQKNIACIYLDIYATQDLKGLTNQLANSIYSAFPEKTGVGKKFWDLIKLFRPIISIDPINGSPEISLDINQPKQLEKTIPQLLQFLEDQSIKTVIAIDEFQQILTYPEKNVEAILRTAIQPLKKVTMIFCGSNQAMMQEIFNSAKRPFYASCKNINLQQIKEEKYSAFIKEQFKENQRTISDEAIAEVLDYTMVHTYYTQVFCHELFQISEKKISLINVQNIKQQLILENEGVFFQYRNLLTPTQWHLLKAIAKEVKLFQPYNKIFVNKYQLGSSAIVKRSLQALLEKEMIYRDNSIKEPYYTVYDKFLLRWLGLQ